MKAVLCATSGFLLAYALHDSGLLETFEHQALDLQLRALAEESPERPEAVLVIIDEHCIDFYRGEMKMGWPWRREMYTYLLDACKAGGARAVIFDLIFIDPSPYTAEDDRAFADAMKSFGPAYLAVALSDTPDSRYQAEVKTDPAVVRSTAPGKTYYAAVPLVPELAEASRGSVDVRAVHDSDGVLRRYDLTVTYKNQTIPSIALVAAHHCGQDTFPRWAPHLTWRTRRQPYPTIDFAQVVQGEVEASVFKDRVVIVGAAAAALQDIRSTPLDRAAAGTTVHAYALADLLDGRSLHSARGAPAVLAVVALLAALITRLCPPLVSVLSTLAGIAALPALSLWRLSAGSWLPLVALELAAVATVIITAAVNYAVEGRRKRQIKRAFMHYVSAQVVEKLLKDPDAIALSGERKTLTVLFLDFAGFTTLSEKLDPLELVRYLNEYHSLAVDEILLEDGTWDKFVGDAVMAFWGEPLEQIDHEARACRAALGIQRKLVGLAERLQREGGAEMHARIGLNTGVMTVGNMGSATYMDYTVIGDEVNLASRLEGANKLFETKIIITEATRKGAAHVRSLGRIRVKGKEQPVAIYELLDGPPTDAHRRFEEGLAAFARCDFAAARAIFESVGDGPSRFYLKQCDLAPADGVVTLTEK